MRRQQEVQKRKVWAASMQHKFSQSLYEETIFRKYDADNSGTMDAKELNAALNELGLKVERRDVAALLASMDIGDPDATGAEAAGKGDGQVRATSLRERSRTRVFLISHYLRINYSRALFTGLFVRFPIWPLFIGFLCFSLCNAPFAFFTSRDSPILSCLSPSSSTPSRCGCTTRT
jgi:hypothetical protein